MLANFDLDILLIQILKVVIKTINVRPTFVKIVNTAKFYSHTVEKKISFAQFSPICKIFFYNFFM